MKVPLIIGEVNKDPMSTIPVKVGAHVIPMLMEIYPDGVVNMEDAKEESEFDETTEYARLEHLYGNDQDTGMSFVQKTYGAEGRGELKKAMKSGLKLFDKDAFE